MSTVWTFLRVPKGKTRAFAELNILFSGRVSARRPEDKIVDISPGRIGDRSGKMIITLIEVETGLIVKCILRYKSGNVRWSTFRLTPLPQLRRDPCCDIVESRMWLASRLDCQPHYRLFRLVASLVAYIAAS